MTAKSVRARGRRALVRARAARLSARQVARRAPGVLSHQPWDLLNPDVYRVY
jgi:hypothetical protein